MSTGYVYGEPLGRLSNFKPCISASCYDNVTLGFCQSIMTLCVEMQKAGIEFHTILTTGNTHVDDARNKLVREFLLTDCTHLVMIDADMRIDYDEMLRFLKHDVDVVAAVNQIKNVGRQDFAVDVGTFGEIENGLMRVKGASTAIIKIARRVLEKLWETEPKYHERNATTGGFDEHALIFERIEAEDTHYGGDYAFCYKWRKAGGKVYVDPALRNFHIGMAEWDGNYGVHLKQTNGAGIRDELRQIADKTETERTLIDLHQIYGNEYSATVEQIAALIAIVRELPAGSNVLECGSGLTTLVMAAANPEIRITSLEQDELWLGRVTELIERYGIKNVEIVKSPLIDYDGFKWYPAPAGETDFDFVLCDGPRKVRRGLYDVMNRRVRDGAFIVYDDYTRLDPEDIKRWGGEVRVMGEQRQFCITRKVTI